MSTKDRSHLPWTRKLLIAGLVLYGLYGIGSGNIGIPGRKVGFLHRGIASSHVVHGTSARIAGLAIVLCAVSLACMHYGAELEREGLIKLGIALFFGSLLLLVWGVIAY